MGFDRAEWTIKCLTFGAELFKKLNHGQISKVKAVDAIKDFSPDLTEQHAKHLVKTINDLMYK